MQVSEQFAKVLRGVALAFLVVAGTFLISPPSHVDAQNAGTVGIQAILQPVFTAQGATASSKLFQDIGQGANILRYCDTNFQGTIDLEWSPTGVAPFFALATASWIGQNDNSCHTLTVNGYFPNMRSTLTWTAGTVNAWYSASSGPVGYAAPAVNSSGPVSPVQCDIGGQGTFAPNITSDLLGVFPGLTDYICEMTVSFSAAPTAGTLTLGYAPTSACTSPVLIWQMQITANTPQVFQVGGPLGAFLQTPASGTAVCVTTTGITANVTISPTWAHLSQ